MRLEGPGAQRLGELADMPRRGGLEPFHLGADLAVRERGVPRFAPCVQQPLLGEGPFGQLTHRGSRPAATSWWRRTRICSRSFPSALPTAPAMVVGPGRTVWADASDAASNERPS